VQRLDLGDVEVGRCLGGMCRLIDIDIHLKDCTRCLTWLHQVLPTPYPCMHYVIRMQVTSRGLQRLLMLPALVELHIHIFTDDLDDFDVEDAESYHEIAYERSEELTAMLDQLKALFAQHGRRLTSGRTR
jgi:hypothetical protein